MARVDSPKDFLSMSAYGKPQPPQLHGQSLLGRIYYHLHVDFKFID